MVGSRIQERCRPSRDCGRIGWARDAQRLVVLYVCMSPGERVRRPRDCETGGGEPMAGVWQASAELERRVAADGARSLGRVFGRTSRMAKKKKVNICFQPGKRG